MLRRLVPCRGSTFSTVLPRVSALALHCRRTFSADDLFAQMESEESLVNTENFKHQKQDLPSRAPIHPSPAPTFFSNFDLSPITVEQSTQLNNLRSKFLTNKIESLTSLAAERRDQGIVDEKLEAAFGAGASREWIDINEAYQAEQNLKLDSTSSSSSSSLSIGSVLINLAQPRSFSEALKELQNAVNDFKAVIATANEKNDGGDATAHPVELPSDALDLLFATAMQSVLAHSRSPVEARQALEFVKLFSLETAELESKSNNSSNKKKQQKMNALQGKNNDDSNGINSNNNNNNYNYNYGSEVEKSSSLSSSTATPLVWMSAVEAGALALVTPEFFSRLLDEALEQIDNFFAEHYPQKYDGNSSPSTSAAAALDSLSSQLSTFYTSALSWSASQFDIETSLKTWSHCLKYQTKYLGLGNPTSSSSACLLRNAALVIRSTNELVAVSAEGSTAVSLDSDAIIGGTSSSSSSVAGRSSISGSASKFDGGIRNSMFQFFASNVKTMNMNDLSWENFEAILSCFDSETQVKLMKLRMLEKTSTKNTKEKGDHSSSNSKINETSQLFELLKRLVAAADVSGAEEVSQAILSSFTELQINNEILRQLQSETILLMMRLYCDVLSPTDFDSALSLFTKHCRSDNRSHNNNNDNNDNDDLSKRFPPTSEHYGILLRGVDSAEDASALFLDACSAGVVLDSASYRYLFQRESNTTLERLRRMLPEPTAQILAQLDDSGVLPPLPLGADAHALRLKELDQAGVISLS